MLLFCFSTAAFTPPGKVEVIARKLIQFGRRLDCCLIELLRHHSTITFGVFANLIVDFGVWLRQTGRSARTKTNEQTLFDAKPASYRALQNETIRSLIRTEESLSRMKMGGSDISHHLKFGLGNGAASWFGLRWPE